MIVGMWMTKDVDVIEVNQLISKAASVMAEKRVRRLPVLEKTPTGSHLVGIVSKGDILHAFPPEVNPFSMTGGEAFQTNITVGEIMHRHLVTTNADAPLEQAAELMRNSKVGCLPVVREGVLVGMLTKSDIFRAFASMFASTKGSARITFDMSRGDDAFALINQLAGRRKVHVLSLVTSRQDERPVCVVRIDGPGVDLFLDDIWKSGHPVLSVIR